MYLGQIANDLSLQSRQRDYERKHQHRDRAELSAGRDAWYNEYIKVRNAALDLDTALKREQQKTAEQNVEIVALRAKNRKLEDKYADAELRRDKLWDAWAFYRKRFKIRRDRFDKADFGIVVRTDDDIEFFP